MFSMFNAISVIIIPLLGNILAYPVRLATFNLKISHDPDIDEYLSSDALIRIILIVYADFRGCKFAGLD